MQALSIAFEAIVPLFLIIAVGYGVKRLGWIGPEEVLSLIHISEPTRPY